MGTGTIPLDTSGGSGGFDPSSWKSWGKLILDHGGDVISAVSSFAKDHAVDALTAWNVYNSAKRQSQADDYAQGALKDTQSAYDAKAPLRTLGLAGLQNPGANVPNIDNIRNLATKGSGNPFTRGLPMAGVGVQPLAPGAIPTQNPGDPNSLPLALGDPRNKPQGVVPYAPVKLALGTANPGPPQGVLPLKKPTLAMATS